MLKVIVAMAMLSAASVVGAQDAPVTRPLGGCSASGKICLGPTVMAAMTAYDATHQKVVGSFSAGLGYGITINQGQWNAYGFDLYLSMQTGPIEGISTAGMFKFANGYARIGVAYQILGGEHSLLFPAGFGVDF